MFRKTRSFVSLIVLFILLSSLTGTAVAAPAAPRAKWTVMVYMSGDNDLEYYVVSDIETELALIGSTDEVQVIALADRAPHYDKSRGDWQTTKLYHVTPGMIADSASADAAWDAQHADELDMGDPQTLIDFVTWTKANYPADHYALYFWGHGWSWHPGWVMEDDTNNEDTLDYDETKDAIPSLGFIDVVGYDGCNMASIEIFNLWHGHATAVTSSQEFVAAEGIQYDIVLSQLSARPGMTADEVAIATSQSASTDKTWSAVAVDDRFDTFLDAVDAWSLALKAGLPANRKKYDQALTATRSFWQASVDKDLYDMANEINLLVGDSNVTATGLAVMDAVKVVVLHERHASSYADAHGITIYGLSNVTGKGLDDYLYYQSKVDFATQTGWGDFLDAYAR